MYFFNFRHPTHWLNFFIWQLTHAWTLQSVVCNYSNILKNQSTPRWLNLLQIYRPSLWITSMTSIFSWKQELKQIYDFLKKPCVIKTERKYRELCNPTKKEAKMTFEFRNYPPLLASRKPTPYFSMEEKFAFYSGKKWFFSQKGVLTVCLRKKKSIRKNGCFL